MTDDERIDLLVAASEYSAGDLIRLVGAEYKDVGRAIFLDPVRLERWKLYVTVGCVAVALGRTGECLGKGKVPEIFGATERVLNRWDPGALVAFVEFVRSKPTRDAEVHASVDAFNSKNPPSEWRSKDGIEQHATGFWVMARVLGRPIDPPEIALSIELGEFIHNNYGEWWQKEPQWAELNARKGNPIGVGLNRGPWVLPGPPTQSSRRSWSPLALIRRERRDPGGTGYAIGSAVGSVAGVAYGLLQWAIWFGGAVYLFVAVSWWVGLLWLLLGWTFLDMMDKVLGTMFKTIFRTQSRDDAPPPD